LHSKEKPFANPKHQIPLREVMAFFVKPPARPITEQSEEVNRVHGTKKLLGFPKGFSFECN
jgi:hypothetical protein